MTKRRKPTFSIFFFLALSISLAASLSSAVSARAQDWVRTGTNLGAQKIRIAAADFAPASQDPQTPALKTTFDATLFNDLNNAGIFDLVSKSIAPPSTRTWLAPSVTPPAPAVSGKLSTMLPLTSSVPALTVVAPV